ncbi:acyl-CoA dehydrogenase family protein [Paeniroseomonas aquatica]|uniref:Acyl-CoA dehydrogenase family protein n=1 Tax=Paeniroseomonas aquatica TaxID=373043 RepID=A0ABT8A9F2_9PROT|nr:acyl-CoA dehydrogenase family protein [Paeniroseomonas aquatica]MDN3566437.1 acyl-CoA dehydrogenase family protein [Paeniroseomonas aquatica]
MAAAELGQLEPQRSKALSCAGPVERARALIPLLEAAGPAIEAGRQLTPEVLEALRANDFFRLLTARGIGGQALSLVTFAEICEALAIGDPSTAWCVNQGNVSSLTSSTYLAPEVGRSLFGGRDQALAWGAQHNQAAAVVVPGGFQVTGTWDFASGSRHATTLGAHVPVKLADGTPRIGSNGKPEFVTVLFPRGAARITEDWSAMGLRGTGSDTYALDGVFVPDSHACFRDRLEGRQEHGTVTAFTSHLCYATGFAATALGTARGMLDRFMALARGKTARAGAQAMAENHAIQSQVAQLEAKLRSARMYLLGTVGEAWAEAAATGGLSLDTRMAMRLATTSVMGEATEVSVACYRAAGTTAVLESQPFERRFRDALCISQHLQATPAHLEMVGRHLLGVPQAAQFV